jgi:hypothetical protein
MSESTENGLLPGAPIEIIERITIVDGPPYRRRWGTSLRKLKNGDLLASYHETAGRENVNDGSATIIRSRDNGKTWDHPIAIYAEPGWLCGPVSGLRVFPDGTVIAVLGKYKRTINPDTTYGLEMYPTFTYITRSTDHGYTWGELESIDGFWPYFTEMYGTNDPIELSDGRQMMSIQGTREINGHGWESAVTTTTDNGKTLSKPVIIASHPEIDMNDAALTRLNDGRLFAVIRSEQPPFDAYQVYSSDEGDTWTEPKKSGFLGGTVCLYHLRNGNLICFYRDREPDRPGVSVVHSPNNGESWTHIGQIYTSPDWFCGYPAVAQLSDDTFICIYFSAIVDGNSSVQGVFLRDLTQK